MDRGVEPEQDRLTLARLPCGGPVSLLVERAGVDHRLGGLVAAQDDNDDGLAGRYLSQAAAAVCRPGDLKLMHPARAAP